MRYARYVWGAVATVVGVGCLWVPSLQAYLAGDALGVAVWDAIGGALLLLGCCLVGRWGPYEVD